MTVSSTSNRVVYAGNGATTGFPFAFKVQQLADLAVIYTDATGADVTLSAGQYSATGFGLDAGGTVTFAPSGVPIASGTTLTIYRNVAVTQPTSISNQGAVWPQVIEAALDRLTFVGQAVTDAVSRALMVSPTDGGSLNPLPTKTQRANAVLGFDQNGQPYAAQLIAGLSAASAWIATNFLPTNSAATARAALGALSAGDNIAFSGTNTFLTQTAADNSTKAATTAYADRAAGAYVVRSYLAGLGLSNDPVTPNTVLDIAAGVCADSANAVMIQLAATTKSIAGAWASGPAQNGMGTGLTAANNAWYHVFAIVNGGAADVYFDTSVTAANKPVGTTAFRRIGSVRTDGSARILAFAQDGDYVRWKASVLDVNEAAPNASAQLKTLTVPVGLNVHALVNVAPVFPDGIDTLYISDPAANDDQPSASAAPLYNYTSLSLAAGASAGGQMLVRTDQSGRIRYRFNHTSGSNALKIATLGWLDRRGRDS
jgi:hypothetical protein